MKSHHHTSIPTPSTVASNARMVFAVIIAINLLAIAAAVSSTLTWWFAYAYSGGMIAILHIAANPQNLTKTWNPPLRVITGMILWLPIIILATSFAIRNLNPNNHT